MRGLFSCMGVKTNEEYKSVIKQRMRIMVAIGIIGAITLVVALLAEFQWSVSIDEYMMGVYAGVGTGLIIAAVFLWIKNKRILGNEVRLKESRLINTDERIREISNRAFRSAAIIMLITMYAGALIGGLFYPILVKVLLFLICLFLLSYMVIYRYYDKKM